MKEYGNYLEREDIYISDSNYIGRELLRIKNIGDILVCRKIIHNTALTLLEEAREKHRGNVYMYESDGNTLLVAEFDYNSKIYYWWEKYQGTISENVKKRIQSFDTRLGESGLGLISFWEDDELFPMTKLINSTLEIVVMKAPLRTYVLYSINENQSPMIENMDSLFK